MIKEHHKCLIIGAGPAGYTAAIYAARAELKPVMYVGMQPGGQLMDTTEVDNFPGYPKGVEGPQMMEDMRGQAERFGTDVRTGVATQVFFNESPKRVLIGFIVRASKSSNFAEPSSSLSARLDTLAENKILSPSLKKRGALAVIISSF